MDLFDDFTPMERENLMALRDEVVLGVTGDWGEEGESTRPHDMMACYAEAYDSRVPSWRAVFAQVMAWAYWELCAQPDADPWDDWGWAA